MTVTWCGLFPALVLVLIFTTVSESLQEFESLNHLREKVNVETQTRAVVDLLRRLIGPRSQEFIVSVDGSLSHDGLDVCELRSVQNNQILVVGSSGVATATGIYDYLKYFCNCHVSWSGDQIQLPNPLPVITGVLKINTQHR